MGERRTSRKYFETLLKGSVLKCLVPTTGFWSFNAFWAWQVGRVIRSAMAFISHFCLERSPQETFWKGEVKQTHKQEVTGENGIWHQAEKVCSFPAESVGISARLPDCVSLCLIFFLHSSPGKMGVFLSIKMRARRSPPHRCSIGNRSLYFTVCAAGSCFKVLDMRIWLIQVTATARA